MKNKKGFTLIELLAVIIILAVIALIAIPIILNMIEQAKKGAARDTAYGYVQAIDYNNGFADINSEGYTNIPDNNNEKEFYTVEEINNYNIKYKGKGPDSGVVTITNRKVSSASLCIGKYKVDYSGKEVTKIEKSNDCTGLPDDEEEPEVVIPDEHPCVLETETKNNKEYFYIDSVEDMYAFAASVNDGNNYSGKVVKLRNNLDFSNYTSNKKSKVCTDNDNDNGYTPIGSYSNPFKGTFEGNAKTISNLTISKSSDDNVGIFGGIEGTVRGLNLDNITVTGHNNVAALTGYANRESEINDILVKNVTINGSSNVTVIAGALDNNSVMDNIVIKDGTVTSTSSAGIVSGYFYTSNIKSVVIAALKINCSNLSNNISKFIYSDKYIVNDVAPSSYSLGTNDINTYESNGIDTIIGGDNDRSGYYFDYKNNTSKEIVLKKADDIDFNLEGEGTAASPYLIKSENDWRTATIKVHDSKVFKLTSNLNFSSKNFYMMGSSQNEFNGTFYGGAYQVANIQILNNTGLKIGVFGSIRNATIIGLKVKNIYLDAYGDVGALVGYVWANSNIKEIVIDNGNVSGTRDGYVGGIVGALDNNSSMDTVIVRNSTLTNPNSAGIVTGYIYSSSYKYILVESMNINVGTIINPSNNYALSNNVVINGTRKTDGFAVENIGDINYYAAVGLDTWIGGDNNNSKYYVDYDDNGVITVKDSARDPFTFDLDGEGTSASPYLIKSEEDWKKATLKLNQSGIYFKLEEDLDFSNKKFYMLGLSQHENYHNPFKGTLYGEAHTISNVTIHADKIGHIGVIGDLSGAKVEGLNIKNANISSGGCVGAFSYVNNGSVVREITLDNITITSPNANTYAGIISCAVDNGSNINNIVVKNATFNGGYNIGYGHGYMYSSSISNIIYERVNMNANSTHWGISSVYYSDIKENGTPKSGGFDTSNIDNLRYYQGKVETMYDGDNNNNGYFFDYVGGKVYVVKAYTTTNGLTSSTAVKTHTNSSGSDTTAPTCTLNHVIVLSNGFEYSFSCTDETEINRITSLFDHDPYNGQYDSSSFNTIGTIKNGTISNSNRTSSYTSRWTTANQNPPDKNTCYYFSYGGEDKAGNYSVYHTDQCYQY